MEDSPHGRFATEDSPQRRFATKKIRHTTNVTENLSVSVGPKILKPKMVSPTVVKRKRLKSGVSDPDVLDISVCTFSIVLM